MGKQLAKRTNSKAPTGNLIPKRKKVSITDIGSPKDKNNVSYYDNNVGVVKTKEKEVLFYNTPSSTHLFFGEDSQRKHGVANELARVRKNKLVTCGVLFGLMATISMFFLFMMGHAAAITIF